MPRPPRPPRRAITLRLDPAIVEALEETADELVLGRNLLVERAIVAYLERLELPLRGQPCPSA